MSGVTYVEEFIVRNQVSGVGMTRERRGGKRVGYERLNGDPLTEIKTSD